MNIRQGELCFTCPRWCASHNSVFLIHAHLTLQSIVPSLEHEGSVMIRSTYPTGISSISSTRFPTVYVLGHPGSVLRWCLFLPALGWIIATSSARFVTRCRWCVSRSTAFTASRLSHYSLLDRKRFPFLNSTYTSVGILSTSACWLSLYTPVVLVIVKFRVLP